MTRISNLTTIKIGLLRSWHSYWYDSYFYSYLLFNDFKIKDYITGVFYSLKAITDYLYIYRFVSDSILIKTNLIFLDNINYKSVFTDSLYKLDSTLKFFYNRKLWSTFLSGLKVIDLFFDNKLILAFNSLFKCLSNYYYLYKLLLFHTGSNNLYYIYNTNNRQFCRHNNLNYLSDIYSRKTFYSFSDLDLLDLNIIGYNDNNIYRNYSSMTGFIKQPITIDMRSLVTYFISSYFFSVNNSFGSTAMFNLKLIESVKHLENINYYVSIFLVNLLILFKYFNNINKKFLYLDLFKINDLLINFKDACLPINNYLYSNYTNNYLNIYNVRENITRAVVSSLRYSIEKSIYHFENKNVYFYFSLFLKRIPFLFSAKIVTDFLAYMFESGNKIVKSFYYIRNLQRKFYKKRRELEYVFHSKKSEFQNKDKYTKKQAEMAINFYKYVFQLATKRFPLLGIRIECNGSFKKGKMAKTYHYTSWIKDYMLTGSMPNNTLVSDIDYYQYFTILNSSTIGIKTWIFLETYLYNSNNMYVGIVY